MNDNTIRVAVDTAPRSPTTTSEINPTPAHVPPGPYFRARLQDGTILRFDTLMHLGVYMMEQPRAVGIVAAPGMKFPKKGAVRELAALKETLGGPLPTIEVGTTDDGAECDAVVFRGTQAVRVTGTTEKAARFRALAYHFNALAEADEATPDVDGGDEDDGETDGEAN